VSSFSTPATSISSGTYNTFGNLSRNSIRGYDYWDVDFGLIKDFTLTEKTRFEFTAQAFNLFNRVNFSDPNTLVPDTGAPLVPGSQGTFGQITSTRPWRELQFAAKILF